MEFVTVIEKERDPKSKEQLRNISLTLFISKLVENLIYDILMKHFGDKIDTGQHGGRKKYSVLLYMVKLVDFVMANLEKKKAVIMALIDLSKAYNRQCHNRMLTCFNDLGTPNYLLKVMRSYLEKRKMVVRHKGETSDSHLVPGGSPQGTNLGILCYLVNINSCGVPFEEIEDYIRKCTNINEMNHPIIPLPPPNINEKAARFKYIDDLSLCQSVDLSDLKLIDSDTDRPLNYRDRTFHFLPDEKNELQKTLNDEHKFSNLQKFMLNEKKTHTVIFNTASSNIKGFLS